MRPAAVVLLLSPQLQQQQLTPSVGVHSYTEGTAATLVWGPGMGLWCCHRACASAQGSQIMSMHMRLQGCPVAPEVMTHDGQAPTKILQCAIVSAGAALVVCRTPGEGVAVTGALFVVNHHICRSRKVHPCKQTLLCRHPQGSFGGRCCHQCSMSMLAYADSPSCAPLAELGSSTQNCGLVQGHPPSPHSSSRHRGLQMTACQAPELWPHNSSSPPHKGVIQHSQPVQLALPGEPP